MWGNVIKKHFETAITDVRARGEANALLLLAGPYGAYMSIWYGMLYGVLERLKENRIRIPKIQGDIDSIYFSLRRYRNAVFHPQAKYISPKLIEIMNDPESPKKIWAVHAGLGQFFLEEFNKLKSGASSEYVKP